MAVLQRDVESLGRELDAAILDPHEDFHGSIGLHVSGHDGFSGYMRAILGAFPNFQNRIDDLFVTQDRTVTRLTYRGTHEEALFGIPAPGRRIEYAGVAMFTLAGVSRRCGCWATGCR